MTHEPAPSSASDLGINNTPNILTMIRMAMVPVVIALLFVGQPTWDLIAAILFAVASITDYFDGYLARVQQQVTVFGKLMDPLADKFLVVSSLIMLQHLGRIHPVIVMLLICREMAITGLRALASAEGLIIPASDSAKWKTATQMVAIPLLMARSAFFSLPLEPVGQVLLDISLAISLWSAKDYIVDFFRALGQQRKRRAEQRREERRRRREERRRKATSV